jgi:hypothetical protein
MSNVSTAHTVSLFDAKKSQALTGQRLAKIGYKSSKQKPAKFPSVCASVPVIGSESIIGSIDSLVPYIRNYLEGVQDSILRANYESSDGQLSLVTDQDISIDSCVKFLAAESTGGRLTKEFLVSWFGDVVQESVELLVAEKLGYVGSGDEGTIELTEEQTVIIGKHVNAYRDLVSSLAGGKTFLQEKQIVSLKNVLSVCEEDDTNKKLVARLDGMLVREKLEDLLEL